MLRSISLLLLLTVAHAQDASTTDTPEEDTVTESPTTVAPAAEVPASSDVKYTDKYDNINLEEILKNRRLLISYVNCVLDKGRCNAEGKELKANLVEALSTGCAKCTERQEAGAYTVLEYLIKNEPEIWKELVAKYDPTGEYRKKYEERAKANGIEIPE